MPRFMFALGVLVASACATPTSSQTASTTTPAGHKIAKAESPDDVICENTRPTGSHMIRKVCFTRQEREDMMNTGQDWGGRRPRNNPFIQE